jgi:hypothetical protein
MKHWYMPQWEWPWKYVQWKKPGSKDFMLYDFIYMKYLEKAHLYRQKTELCLTRAKWKGSWEKLLALVSFPSLWQNTWDRQLMWRKGYWFTGFKPIGSAVPYGRNV